jgi:predicted alpha/beta hydrolase family esterase
MDTSSDVLHFASKNDYLNRNAKTKAVKAELTDKSKLKNMAKKAEAASKVDISEKAKELKDNLKQNGSELAKAGGHLLKDAGKVALKALTTPGTGIPIKLALSDSSKPALKNSEIREVRDKEDGPRVIKKPGVFFLSGLHLNGMSSDEGGLPLMADHIEDAKHFSWKEEEKVLKEILKRPSDQPIILVGHSLGGDAVVNLANQLNTLENGFKKVDLLITMDSVGFDNDIIPQNVKKNLNFIGDEDVFFNDGPNIARNTELTNVVNELRSEGHVDIDDSTDVQFKVFNDIEKVLSEFKKQSMIKAQKPDSPFLYEKR